MESAQYKILLVTHQLDELQDWHNYHEDPDEIYFLVVQKSTF